MPPRIDTLGVYRLHSIWSNYCQRKEMSRFPTTVNWAEFGRADLKNECNAEGILEAKTSVSRAQHSVTVRLSSRSKADIPEKDDRQLRNGMRDARRETRDAARANLRPTPIVLTSSNLNLLF
jgi:hypothetical protein